MNKVKFYLERSSAIISIVFGGILSLGSLVTFSIIDSLGGSIMLLAILVFILLFAIAIIILGAILCPSPKLQPNGTYQTRLGMVIALLSCVAILMILEFAGNGILYGILLLVPTAMLAISLTMKHDQVQTANEVKPVSQEVASEKSDTSIASELAKLKELHETGALNDEQYNDAVNKLVK